MTDQPTLKQQAEDFAGELTQTVHAVVADSPPFKVDSVDGGSKFVIQQDSKTGIELTVDSKPLLSLLVNYRCTADSKKRFLAVDKSAVAVYPGLQAQKEPLFRYEYQRDASQTPSAHLHIHAHRDAFTATMVRAGQTTKRGAKRAEDDPVPSLKELHFPLGGSRFRPCLEDVLEMLIEEFGLDHDKGPNGSREALRIGRAAWRRRQTGAAVRDDPESAANALRELGYDVKNPGEGIFSTVNYDRLKRM